VLGNVTRMAGPVVMGGAFSSFSQILWCLVSLAPALRWLQPTLCPGGEDIIAMFFGNVNFETRNAMYVIMTATFDPLGVDGYKMLERIRTLTEPLPGNETHPCIIETAVQGDGPSSLDTIHAIYGRVPILAPVSVAVATLIVLISSRSAINALRFAVGLAWGLAIVLGSITLIYQDGILNWTGITALSDIVNKASGEGEVPWIGPIITFAVALGLLTAFDVLASNICRSGRYEVLWDLHFSALLCVVAFLGLAVSDVPLMNLVGSSMVLASIMGGFLCPREITMPVFWWLGESLGKCGKQNKKPCC
jgi:hypothetical protein